MYKLYTFIGSEWIAEGILRSIDIIQYQPYYQSPDMIWLN